MLEEFKNKKVKILVGSNSGVAIGAGAVAETAIIRMMGIIIDYDNEYIKLSDVQMISANQSWINMGIAGHKLEHVVEETSVSLVNRKNILTVSLVEE